MDGFLDTHTINQLSSRVNFDNITDPENVKVLGHLTRQEREEFAFETKSLVLYFGEEVSICKQKEENAVLAAAPSGYPFETLNGLNVGCGDRLISPYLVPVDIMRHVPSQQVGGEHGALTPGAFLALPDALPFCPNSIDYIVALHMLEHVSDPVNVILHWLSIVKPGGGIGVVVPNWQYTWDAKNDETPFGHKWNSCPDLVLSLHDKHWSELCKIEYLNTLEYKLSFDFVLRKNGIFQPFSRGQLETALSGRQRAENGIFLALEDASLIGAKASYAEKHNT